MAELLRMENVSKCFGSFYANQDVNLTVGEGEVHTLLGENGAGKSTLMNVLIGLYQPTEGKIYMHGEEVHISSPGVAVEHGIGMVHQHFMLIEDMTGLENIILGDKRHKSPLLQVADDRKTVEELMERYGMDIDLDEKVGDMSIGMQQRVEIMKVLFRGADLVILDEPTAVLTDLEVEGLFDIMHSLTDEGKSIIFISHKMREVMHISDYVTVLRRGKSVETVKIADTTEQELADLMIGQKFTENTYQKVTEPGEAAFELKGISYRPEVKHGGLKDVSLTIHKGEILGVAGIDGFYFRSSFDRYKELALINPDNPVELCDEIMQKTGIPTVLMDANDIEQNQLGKCSDFPLTDDEIQDAMRDNPSGQGDELTPLILIRPVQKA